MSGVRVIFVEVGEPMVDFLDRYDTARADEAVHTIVLVDPNAQESKMAARIYTRTGPGYGGWRTGDAVRRPDAEDLLTDIQRLDARDHGTMTTVNAATARRMIEHGFAVDLIAEMLAVSEGDVRRLNDDAG